MADHILARAGEGTAQEGAVALGRGLLEWLGVTGDNSEWGSGVRIAVLDTGVASSPAFASNISLLNLIGPIVRVGDDEIGDFKPHRRFAFEPNINICLTAYHFLLWQGMGKN